MHATLAWWCKWLGIQAVCDRFGRPERERVAGTLEAHTDALKQIDQRVSEHDERLAKLREDSRKKEIRMQLIERQSDPRGMFREHS